jgi:2'-5' RNA ligase
VRLFLAVHLPPEVTADLEARVSQVRPAYPDLRWVGPERWHLTLVFLGEVPEDELARLERRYARRLHGAEEMSVQLAGAGRFDGTALWVGVHGDREQLRTLVGHLDPGGRPYRPHLTVARARARRGTDLRPPVEELRDYEGPAWTAATVHLVRSFLGPAPRYENIASWPLANA